MAGLNNAYEVLGNEETRAKYDQGEDPNDPEQQQQRQQQGGFPGGFPGGFGNGGQQFQFHFT